MTKSRHIAPPRRAWTEAELTVMRRDYPHRPTWQIAQELGRAMHAVYAKAKNMGVRKTPAYLDSDSGGRLRPDGQIGAPWRFKPGHETWNKGTKGITGKHPATVANHFGPGNRPHTWVPVGSTRITSDGYLQRKVSDTGYPPRDWVAVQRLVWEAAHGPIPSGHRIAFKGGKPITDEALITPDVLECITPAEAMRRNSRHNLPKALSDLMQLRGALNRRINRLEREARRNTDDQTQTPKT